MNQDKCSANSSGAKTIYKLLSYFRKQHVLKQTSQNISFRPPLTSM